MDRFLGDIKNEFRAHGRSWKLVCCGARNAAYRAFRNACDQRDGGVVMLLVDAEDPVRTDSPIHHLSARDGWNLEGVDGHVVHLMVQTMEAWIVADGDELSRYYGQRFRRNALPNRQNLEDEGKRDIERALYEATRRTQKGEYHKIRHASEILRSVDPLRVVQRCPAFARLFRTLGHTISAA
jgi:hypothetical protein